MEVFATLVFFTDYEPGKAHVVATIEHDGAWWLVGSWLESNSTGERTPERIVRLSGLPHQEVSDPDRLYRFVLNNPIPKSVLDGEEQAGYVVAIHPEALKLNGPKTLH